jgi:hypothetical protein
MAVNVGALAALGTGVVLTWSAIQNQKITVTLQDIVSGKKPQPGPMSSGAGTGGGSGSTPVLPTPSGSGFYSNAGLRALWIAAGGNPAKAAVAACIAQHESSGNPEVTSSNPDGGTNVGLWQLDTPGGKGAGFTVSQLQHALLNAHVAIRGSSNGTDWSAWATAPACGV